MTQLGRWASVQEEKDLNFLQREPKIVKIAEIAISAEFLIVPTLKLPNNVEPQEAFAAIEPSDDLIPQDDFEQFLEFIHHT